MSTAARTCPKCNSSMQPGFPVEVWDAGLNVTHWSSELPREIKGLFGGHMFKPRARPHEFLMGFACEQCGFVELYKVTDQELQQFLQAVNAAKAAQPCQAPPDQR